MRDKRETKWFWLDNALVDREDLNIYEKMLYVCLARHIGNNEFAYPGLDTLCKELGIKDTRTIVKHTRTLEEKGLIEVERTKGKTNKYYLKNVNEVHTSNVPTSNVQTTLNVGMVPTSNVPTSTHIGCRTKKIHKEDTIKKIDNNINLNKLNKIEDIPKEEKEVRPMVSSNIKFVNDFKELKDIVVKSTGINKLLVDNTMLPSKYTNINIRELIDKIKESKFLLGKLDTKPNINHFSVKNMIDRIMADAYKDKQEKKAALSPSRRVI